VTTRPELWRAFAVSIETGEPQPFVAGSERSSREAAESALDRLREMLGG
jgi:hypothetical protein